MFNAYTTHILDVRQTHFRLIALHIPSYYTLSTLNVRTKKCLRVVTDAFSVLIKCIVCFLNYLRAVQGSELYYSSFCGCFLKQVETCW